VLPDWPLPLPALGTGPSWDRLSLLQQQMDQVFNNTLSQFAAGAPGLGSFSSPNFDLREEKDHYTVRADMPGADKATIKVAVEGRMLTISGQRSALSETQTGDAVLRSERNMAQFVRTVQLPGPVKAAEVDAKYENGVLTLKLPKADQATASTQVPVH
jgi:HSP20 family protein